MKNLKIRCKVWVEIDGEPLLGSGRVRLLQAIAEHGSLNAAAKELDISYRKVWAQIKEMERIAPFPMFIRRTGGVDGGATELTIQAQTLLNQFKQVSQEIREAVDDICKVHVGNGYLSLESDSK